MRYVRRASGTVLAPRASAAARASLSSSNPFNRTAPRAGFEENMRRLVRFFAATAAVSLVAGCASVGGGPGGTVTNTPDQMTQPGIIWPVKTREHVDLWLHGFALLQEDTTFVPFFRR